MKILIVGGGPGGLYLGLQLKRADPAHDVTVVERNAPDETYGFGVLVTDDTLDRLASSDPETHAEIAKSVVKTTTIEVRYLGTALPAGTGCFSGIARKRLLNILRRRCEKLGVRLVFNTEIVDTSTFARYDLVVGADGVRSRIRTARADVFGTTLEPEAWKYIWLGTTRVFERFTFSFKETDDGLFHCHIYRYDAGHCTVIVECDEGSWRRAGLDRATEAESLAYCERVFADDLGGHPLLANRSRWGNFVLVRNARWYHGNLVLLGDAAHTAHFTTGTGTTSALEDAIALAAALRHHPAVEPALAAYEAERRPIVERYQRIGRESLGWFEDVRRAVRFVTIMSGTTGSRA